MVAIAGALGASLLPESLRPYLGVLPIALGLRAAWRTFQERRTKNQEQKHPTNPAAGPGIIVVTAVTFASGGDNIGVYVPVFASAEVSGLLTYTLVFLILVALWCAAGRFLATRPAIARALSQWATSSSPSFW